MSILSSHLVHCAQSVLLAGMALEGKAPVEKFGVEIKCKNSDYRLNKLIGLKGKAFTYLLKQLATPVVAKLLLSQLY
jgi:hypothetical protein